MSAHDSPRQTPVVLVHGLYLGGWSMALLDRSLRRRGYVIRRFSYATVRADIPASADRLHLFLAGLRAEEIHLVCHSLGGLVVNQLFHRHPGQRPGRVVTLGTPHNGSHVARRLSATRWLRWLLGRSIEGRQLLDGRPAWPRERPLGVIAGSRGIGLGALVPGLPAPNDGTVTVAETRAPEAQDHVTLPVTHSSMLWSAAVARQVASFLETGRFRRANF